MFRDLREFLAKLEENGQLVHIKDSIYPEPAIREIGRASTDLPNGPAVIMDNIKGMKGMKVALNVHGSWANIALMMGLDKNTPVQDQFFNFLEAWDKYPRQNISDDKVLPQVMIYTQPLSISPVPHQNGRACFFKAW